MSSVGPQLPPAIHDKRKRDSSHNNSDSGSSSDAETGPAPPIDIEETVSKKQRVIGPALPPPSDRDGSGVYSDHDHESSSDDDDDFGPSLPSVGVKSSDADASRQMLNLQAPPPPVAPSKRDDWMVVPPTGGDWTSRVDPTKLKNRKFNTGKGAKGPMSSGENATDAWHETPQEKQARLQREMMGIKTVSTGPSVQSRPTKSSEDVETTKKLKEYNKSRGPSLYQAHQKSSTKEEEDDPSARAFDREKDIGGGLQINETQRRDLMKKAGDFNSRFSSAKYL